jgi:CRISPR/Cas system CSM-associated protein Csm2 small subunit
VPILYAHWEGFTKHAASLYLEFVSRRRLTYRQLRTNFVAIACRQALKEVAASERIDIHGQLVDFLLLNQDERAKIPFEKVIDSKGNLNSTVLREIIFALGVPYSIQWTAKELLIDGSLLKMRNDIAHGRRVEVDQASFEQLYRLLMDGILDQLRDTIENSAAVQGYRR